MLALQVVEAEAGRLYLPQGVVDVTQLGGGEVDRAVRRGLEIGDLPGRGD